MADCSGADPHERIAPRLQLHSGGGAPTARRDAEASPKLVALSPASSVMADRLAARHGWLVERLLGRLAARWPEEIDRTLLRSESWMVLRDVAARVHTEDSIAAVAALAIEERLCQVIGGSEWYRQAIVTRLRPLLETWRGAILAGREPSDHLLSSRLRLDVDALAGRFQELALVFVVDPQALLPGHALLPQTPAIQATAEVISTLTSDQQLAVSLYFHEELTYEQIGRVMDIPAGRAQELMGRAAAAIASDAALTCAHRPPFRPPANAIAATTAGTDSGRGV
ncbi:MAG: sigma factor-like helix-turn-helix DNA-binding protein [Armatimonadota bacterium]